MTLHMDLGCLIPLYNVYRGRGLLVEINVPKVC